ncbi:RNA polymerase sigma factor [Actinomadura barringtoniae]|uniref:RNA polymerase sigma factor n=1 Tax=Actinomadura barringtoniae TaxID=1427535 RepID=A0A939T757_9ACTN|nr:RNA polymerase sigma factor [Actinomadura barringtoniae]
MGTREAAPDRDHCDDAELIRRSRSEPERFARLVDRHAPRIHRYIAQRLGPDTADDLMAETFLVAFRRRNAYDVTRSQALPWLYGIATNLMARHRAAEVKKYRLLERIGPGSSDEEMTEAIVDRVDAQGLSGPLAGALAALPARQRNVLLLVAWADLSYEEVAEALDIPIGTVRSRLSRARTRLRDALGGSDPSMAVEEDER